MKHLFAVLLAVGSAALTVTAQTPGTARTSSSGTAWSVPRTPDGKPDLQGVWGNNSVTPMTRPTQWKDKDKLTDAEVQELKALLAKYVSQGGDAIFGSYVQMALNLKSGGKYDHT